VTGQLSFAFRRPTIFGVSDLLGQDQPTPFFFTFGLLVPSLDAPNWDPGFLVSQVTSVEVPWSVFLDLRFTFISSLPLDFSAFAAIITTVRCCPWLRM